jgi:sulfate transport system ATP-binding protein
MSIVLDHLTKRYDGQCVVDDVSLEVADGELFVLLGASGSGKSTILRLIAGLTSPDGGKILLGGLDVTLLPPQQRGTGFVFQNYSIFRHMSVAENIEFGLKIRKRPRPERARRCEELLDLVGLAGLGNRYPDQLSGGQQQRVALARALAYEPDVLLLDEPLGALDAKIRVQLRRSLKEIQRRLKVTTILVTHDQEEAFELADRIGVIERGRLLEVGEAEKLYERPQSLFVATFLGTGNVIVGRAEAGRARFGPLSLPIPVESPHEDGARVQLLFRPEEVSLCEQPPGEGTPALGQGTIIEQSFAGALRRVRLRLPRLAGTRQLAPHAPFGEEGLLVDAILPAQMRLTGDKLWVGLRNWHILKQARLKILVYDRGTGSITLLALARSLAEQMLASVIVLGVADNPESGEALLSALRDRSQGQALDQATIRLRYGDRADQVICEQAEEFYDLLAIASRENGDTRGGKLSAVLLKVLERSDIPVLVVQGDKTDLKNILICTAAGEPGKSDVRVGGRLARRLGAKVTLLYVTRSPGEVSSIARAHLDRAAATLRALDVPVQISIRTSASPSEGILGEAREAGHDLIVVGGHDVQSGVLFGIDDVAFQVLRGADRPVLVVSAERS